MEDPWEERDAHEDTQGLEWYQLRKCCGATELSPDRATVTCRARGWSGNKVRTDVLPEEGTTWCVTLLNFGDPRSSIYSGVISTDEGRWWSLCSDGDGLYRHGNRSEWQPGTDWSRPAEKGEKWFFCYEREAPLSSAFSLTIRRESVDGTVLEDQVAFTGLPEGLCAFVDVNIGGDSASLEFDLLPPK